MLTLHSIRSYITKHTPVFEEEEAARMPASRAGVALVVVAAAAVAVAYRNVQALNISVFLSPSLLSSYLPYWCRPVERPLQQFFGRRGRPVIYGCMIVF